VKDGPGLFLWRRFAVRLWIWFDRLLTQRFGFLRLCEERPGPFSLEGFLGADMDLLRQTLALVGFREVMNGVPVCSSNDALGTPMDLVGTALSEPMDLV